MVFNRANFVLLLARHAKICRQLTTLSTTSLAILLGMTFPHASGKSTEIARVDSMGMQSRLTNLHRLVQLSAQLRKFLTQLNSASKQQ